MNDESDLARLARIGDSVFAVVVTMLVYRVRLPSHDTLVSLALPELLPFLGDLGAVVMSFLVASLFWLGHWRVFRLMKRSDVRFVALSFAFLGALVLLPISTSLMSLGRGAGVGAAAYAANLCLLAAFETLFRRHARRLDPQAFGDVALLLTPTLLMLAFGCAAIAAFYSTALAQTLLSVTFLAPLAETRWGMGRLMRGPPPDARTPGGAGGPPAGAA